MDKKIIQKQVNILPKREKHTGEEAEHGQFFRWMKALGYYIGIKTRRPNIVSNLYAMPKKKIKPDKQINTEDESFENLQLNLLWSAPNKQWLTYGKNLWHIF